MLMLTRNRGQAVRVGEIDITVVSVRGDRVRLGFEGPREIAIIRPEAQHKYAPPRAATADRERKTYVD